MIAKNEVMSVYCSVCGRITDHSIFLLNGIDWEYGVKGRFHQGKCSGCGLVTMIPMPTPESIISFYPDSYHGYQAGGGNNFLTKWLIRRNLKQREHFYASLIGNRAQILDVGSAEGGHFDVWKENRDWEIFGFEFNEHAAALGRSAGRDIQTATMETYNSQGKTFDLIIMNHLLEHVIDPMDTVRKAYNLLKPGGFIVGETPNIASLDFILFREYWGGCHWPRHLHQFTPFTIKTMLKNSGYSSITFQYPLHTSHWALSIQNFLQSKKLTSVSLKNGRAWYYPLLLLGFVPLSAMQKITGHTGIIGFVAKKPSMNKS